MKRERFGVIVGKEGMHANRTNPANTYVILFVIVTCAVGKLGGFDTVEPLPNGSVSLVPGTSKASTHCQIVRSQTFLCTVRSIRG